MSEKTPEQMIREAVAEVDAALDAKYGAGKWHCDDICADPTSPACVRAFIDRARAPAHGHLTVDGDPDPRPFPKLFATHPERGRVRVTIASRFGDVGITKHWAQERGYETRVMLPELSDFSESP